MVTNIVIDNALNDPEGVREAALSHPFKAETGPDGTVYQHISLGSQPIEAVAGVLAPHFPGKQIEWKLTFWRQDWAGELPHSFCHADRICAEWAAIYYAMPAELCLGGTAFWSHTGTGLDHLPTDPELKSAGILPHCFHPWMTEETKDPDKWSLRGLVAMAPNRLACYPTKMWHSRLPAEGSGTCQEDGRMVWVGFFNVT